MDTIESLERRYAELESRLDGKRTFQDIALWAGESRVLTHDAIALAKSLQARLDDNDASFTEMMGWYLDGTWGLPLETSSQQNLENCTNFLIALGIALQIRVDDIAAQNGEETK